MTVAWTRADVYTDDVVEFVDTYHWFDAHGVTPEAGGLNDQPASWRIALGIFSDALAWTELDKAAGREALADAAAEGAHSGI